MKQTRDLEKMELAGIIRSASLSRIRNLASRDDVELFQPPAGRLVYAHWMSLILVSGKDVRITFKAHFDSRSATGFAARVYGSEKVTQARAVDFFREFSNLTAGRVKAILAENNIQVALSLPALARGFDEVYYRAPEDSMSDAWGLRSGHHSVICSAHIEVFSPISLVHSKGLEAEQGEVSYL